MDIVIIGNGATGISAIETVRHIDKSVKITLISKESSTYSLCALPSYIAGEIDAKNLQRFGDEFYERMGVEPILGRAVAKVVPSKNVVVLDDQTEVHYDKLLIAAGASPIVPRIDGVEKDNVCFLGDLKDAENIKRKAKSTAIKRAVIIGAGNVGIECAVALSKLGVEVSVVEMLDRVLPKMVDKDIAAEVAKLLEKHDIHVVLARQVLEIVGAKKVEGVRLKDLELKCGCGDKSPRNGPMLSSLGGRGVPQTPQVIECDMVVVAIGVKPNIDLVEGAGVATGQGIIVDDKLRTNIENIYAAGDVAEAVDRVCGKRQINAIWPNAVEQGRIAGYNIAGIPKEYDGSVSINVVDIFDVPVVSMGLLSSEVSDYDAIKICREKQIKKFILEDNKLVGMQSIDTSKDSGLMLSLINKKTDISKLKDILVKPRFAYQLLTRA